MTDESRELRLRAEALEWLVVEGDVVVLDMDQSRYLSTNKTGALLWGALAEGATEDELVERLVEAFGIDSDTARRDTMAFVKSLTDRGLLMA